MILSRLTGRDEGPDEDSIKVIVKCCCDARCFYLDRLCIDHKLGYFKTGPEESGALDDQNEWLSSRILFELQSVTENTFKISELLNSRIGLLSDLSRWLFMGVIFLLMVFVITPNILLSNYLIRFFGKIKKGTERIGNKKFGYIIEIEKDDELGKLAAAFNDMSKNLKKAYDGLEEEIKVRKQAEKNLSDSKTRLEFTLKQMFQG